MKWIKILTTPSACSVWTPLLWYFFTSYRHGGVVGSFHVTRGSSSGLGAPSCAAHTSDGNESASGFDSVRPPDVFHTDDILLFVCWMKPFCRTTAACSRTAKLRYDSAARRKFGGIRAIFLAGGLNHGRRWNKMFRWTKSIVVKLSVHSSRKLLNTRIDKNRFFKFEEGLNFKIISAYLRP